MAQGQRPGGLTALAVLNFIFGGLGLLAWLFIAFAIGAIEQATDESIWGDLGAVAYFFVLVGLTISGLLIAAGVGYLGMKRVMGRYFGNAYGITSLALTVVTLLLGQPFGINTIIGLVYPSLTLILLNTTFKDDLVN